MFSGEPQATAHDMNAIEPQVSRTLDAIGIRSTRIIVAVSGGADSMALLWTLHQLRESHQLSLHVAHLNHGLRAAESEADAEWVAERCRELDLPATIERCDTRAIAAAEGKGLEETARNLRYDFLSRTARSVTAPWVALAHNADDQVETILHRIIRGTGLAGLAGMSQQRPLAEGVTLVRPLLGVQRTQIEEWLRAAGKQWRDDSSNAALEFTRNRIRRVLLPLLRNEFNPQVGRALLTLSRQAEDAQAVVHAAAAALAQQAILDRSPGSVRIDCDSLTDVPPHLARALFQLIWTEQGWPAGAMTFAHWDALAAQARDGTSSVSLPGHVTATRRGKLLHLSSGDA